MIKEEAIEVCQLHFANCQLFKRRMRLRLRSGEAMVG
jgi:hypothetical protein